MAEPQPPRPLAPSGFATNVHIRIYRWSTDEAVPSPGGKLGKPEAEEATTELGVVEDRRDILESFANELCEIHVFDPSLTEDKFYPERLWFFHKIGLAEGSESQVVPANRPNSSWRLKSLGESGT